MNEFKRKILAWALIVVMMTSVLLPFFAFYQKVENSTLPSASSITAFLGEKILICTGDGFAFVKLSDLAAGKIPVKQHKEFFCPLCYLAVSKVGKAIVAFAVVVFLLLQVVSPPSIVLDRAVLKNVFLFAKLPSRAPPLF